MKRYIKYKNSGIEWIGEIPEHWIVNKFNRISFFQEGPGLRNWQFTQDGVPVICVSNIIPPNIDFSNYKKCISVDEYETTYKHFTVKKGDILLASSGASWGKVAEYESDEVVILNTSTIRLNENDSINVDRRLIKWIIQSPYIAEQLNNLLTGSCQPNFGPTHLKQLKCIYPVSRGEQTAIASYLDRKTAEIEELITKKERLLQLYEEEKTALINQSVAKGLNPHVPMKDSGIDWLGEIPEHWEVKRVATFGDFSKGKGIPRSELKDDGFPAILYGDIYTKYNIKAEIIKNHISEETTKTSVAIEKGDLLFTGSGETVEDIGKCIAYLGDEAVYAGGDVIVLKQKKYNSLFLSYSLNSNASIYQKASMAKGQIIIHIYASNLREIIIPLPNNEDQTAIVEYIEKETARIDTKVAKTKKLIELLKEYKTALISEVVTGKVKVV